MWLKSEEKSYSQEKTMKAAPAYAKKRYQIVWVRKREVQQYKYVT